MKKKNELRLEQDRLSQEKRQCAMFVEPLQEISFQTILALKDTQAEVQKMLEEVRSKVAEHVSAQFLNEVVETTAKAKEIAEEAKHKIVQLTASEKKVA